MDGYFIHIANRLDKIRRGGDNNKPTDFFGSLKQELVSWELWRAVLAEFLATFVFVFIGTMSTVHMVPIPDPAGQFVRIAFAFGLMIAICIQMIGHVSGGHMNPAVSIAMAVAMEISPLRALLYTTGQVVGGILGSLLLKGITPSRLHENLGLTSVHADLTGGQAFACELVFTFILVFSIFGTTDPNRALFGSPALGIGLTVGVVHLAGIPLTGASMNPARSLASSVVSTGPTAFNEHWVYWVGPILGGIVAAVAYKYLFCPYKRNISVDDAANRMMEGNDMILIPKSYFTNKEHVNEKSQQSNL